MFMTKLKLVAGACLVAGGLFASGAGVAAHGGGTGRGGDGPASDPGARAGRAQVVKSLCYNVYNLVPGEPEILRILTPGAEVRKGQLVCKLDSSTLKDTLTNQEITTQGAESSYLNASLTRQVAEIAVNEYREGIYKQDMQTALGELALAESELKRAEDRLDWSDKMLEKRYLSPASNIADKLSLQRSKFRLEQAQTRKQVLEKYTREKTMKELRAEREKARSVELARKATWELEKQKTKAIRREIAQCNIHAPADGELILAPGIERGATVRERQLVFRVLTGDPTDPPR